MDVSPRPHPRFENPPVVETAFSIEFSQPAGFGLPFFGLYWATIRDRYPKWEVHPPLLSQIENLSGEATSAQVMGLSFNIGTLPLARCWFHNEEETQLIQLQLDRFIFNWKRGIPNEPYPHYENIRPILMREWDGFFEFANKNGFGVSEVKQCEITYINHIELGRGWKGYDEISNVLSPWSGATSRGFLPAPEDVNLGVRYRMPDKLGRLYVRALPAIRNSDKKEILQLTITARGRPPSSDREGILSWFDDSQAWTSGGFVDFTTDKMHSLWGERKGQ